MDAIARTRNVISAILGQRVRFTAPIKQDAAYPDLGIVSPGYQMASSEVSRPCAAITTQNVTQRQRNLVFPAWRSSAPITLPGRVMMITPIKATYEG